MCYRIILPPSQGIRHNFFLLIFTQGLRRRGHWIDNVPLLPLLARFPIFVDSCARGGRRPPPQLLSSIHSRRPSALLEDHATHGDPVSRALPVPLPLSLSYPWRPKQS
jgi:hypothetical protein